VKAAQRAAAEQEWQERAEKYAREHPDATPLDIIDALGNPDGLLVTPMARVAVTVGARLREEGAQCPADG
jgi:hypothetical protein